MLVRQGQLGLGHCVHCAVEYRVLLRLVFGSLSVVHKVARGEGRLFFLLGHLQAQKEKLDTFCFRLVMHWPLPVLLEKLDTKRASNVHIDDT